MKAVTTSSDVSTNELYLINLSGIVVKFFFNFLINYYTAGITVYESSIIDTYNGDINYKDVQ